MQGEELVARLAEIALCTNLEVLDMIEHSIGSHWSWGGENCTREEWSTLHCAIEERRRALTTFSWQMWEEIGSPEDR
jgi:hypothetical protein